MSSPKPLTAAELLAESRAYGPAMQADFVEVGGKVYLKADCHYCPVCEEWDADAVCVEGHDATDKSVAARSKAAARQVMALLGET